MSESTKDMIACIVYIIYIMIIIKIIFSAYTALEYYETLDNIKQKLKWSQKFQSSIQQIIVYSTASISK